MKRLLVILYIIVVIFGALSIAEATVIDNLPRTGYMGGFGDSWATYWGQSFIAEPGLAQSLTFELRYESGDGDLNFRLLLTTVDGQWNGVDYSEVNPGMVLFESESLSLAHMPHNSEWILFSVELGGIDLEDGQTYAFVLDAFEDGDGIQSKALVGMRDGYQDGHTFWLGYSKTDLEDSFPNSDRDDYFNNLYWGNNVDRAMAFSLTFIPVPEPATVDVHPDTLNKKSKGKYITCYIELPEDYSVEDIDIETVMLAVNGSDIPVAESSPTGTGDYNDNGIPDVMFKFDRQLVQDACEAGAVEMILTCHNYDGISFEGTDTVLVIDKGKEHYSENQGSIIY